jgi:two-component system alkaline phosphatase synthesis response regulator PhoP
MVPETICHLYPSPPGRNTRASWKARMTGKKRILVVDDEPDFCSLIQCNLEKEGFEVEVAYDGIEGLASVRANPPDAIVLDVMMPEKDGYAVCKEIKEDESLANIPIVMLTVVASHLTSTRYSHYDKMSMPADDYLPKPASSSEITQSLKELLGL